MKKIFVSELTPTTARTVRTRCDCGERNLDRTAERDCEESVRLQSVNQADLMCDT